MRVLEQRKSYFCITYKSWVRVIETFTNACIMVDYLHHTHWGNAAFPQTMRERDIPCAPCYSFFFV